MTEQNTPSDPQGSSTNDAITDLPFTVVFGKPWMSPQTQRRPNPVRDAEVAQALQEALALLRTRLGSDAQQDNLFAITAGGEFLRGEGLLGILDSLDELRRCCRRNAAGGETSEPPGNP